MIQLSINENPYTPDDLIRTALASVKVNRYPDEAYKGLKADLLTFLSTTVETENALTPDQIVFGNGSDELISLCLQSLLSPGDTVIAPTPCFSEYIKAADSLHLSFVGIPMDQGLMPSVKNLISAAKANQAKMIIICRPDNPSGQLMPLADVLMLLSTFEGYVLLDEAYIEFSEKPFETLALLGECDKLMILRTFSKAFGLAGLRIGYMLASEAISLKVDSLRHPYNVNAPAVAVASAILNNPQISLETIHRINRERERLFLILSELTDSIYPSQANFLLIRDKLAGNLYKALLNDGILVRRFDHPMLFDCLRISIGTETENDRLVSIWRQTKREAV